MISGVLLAAGRGKRLRPLSDRLPKPAVPLLDIPAGAWGLTRLLQHGEVTVNVSHLGATIASELASYGGFRVLDEGAEGWGSAATLKALAPRLASTFLIWNSDRIFDLDLADLLATHRSLGTKVTVVASETPSRADFIVRGDLAEAPVNRTQVDRPGVAYLGVAAIELDALDSVPDRRPLDLAKGLLFPLAEAGALGIHRYAGYDGDVGTILLYLKTSQELVAGMGPPPPRPYPGRIIEVDGGRAYIGPNASAPEGSLGRGAIVLRGATVEPGARVTEAVVWPNELVPADTEISGGIWANGSLQPD